MPGVSGSTSQAQQNAVNAYCTMQQGAIDQEDVVQFSKDPSKSFSAKVTYPGISKAAASVFVDLVSDSDGKPIRNAAGQTTTEFSKLLSDVLNGPESPEVKKELLGDIKYTLESILKKNPQLDPQSAALYQSGLNRIKQQLVMNNAATDKAGLSGGGQQSDKAPSAPTGQAPNVAPSGSDASSQAQHVAAAEPDNPTVPLAADDECIAERLKAVKGEIDGLHKVLRDMEGHPDNGSDVGGLCNNVKADLDRLRKYLADLEARHGAG